MCNQIEKIYKINLTIGADFTNKMVHGNKNYIYTPLNNNLAYQIDFTSKKNTTFVFAFHLPPFDL